MDFQAQVDLVYQGQAHGTVAQRLLNNGMSSKALRTNDTLRKDEWKHFDMVVVPASQERLQGVADLMRRGLVLPIANGLGKTVLEYEDASDIEGAQVSMDGVTKGRNDRIEYDLKFLPLPITHADFQINIRVLNSSRTFGQTLDTAMAELAARKVSESLEEQLFNGLNSYTFGGGTIFGYTDAPNRNTVTLTTNWDDPSKTGEQILDDVKDLKQANIDGLHFGPYMLYIPTAYETVLDCDFKANSDKTIRARILEVASIEGIQVIDKLSANNVVLVQMTSDVVRMVQGMPLTTVEWQTEGNMIFHFKVMTINVPQVRADQEGNSGVAVLAA